MSRYRIQPDFDKTEVIDDREERLIEVHAFRSIAEKSAERLNRIDELETVVNAAIAYRESQRVYSEGSLKDRVPNGTRINECAAALDAAITAHKGN